MKKVIFPEVERPAVSILMVTYGGWSLVRQALEAVLENTQPCYEVIIVDNDSPDDLFGHLSDEIENARILRNRSNRGFGCAMNQAAGYASGEALLLLNSDAFVHAGWLPPLMETLGRDRNAAAVGPRILNLDGTLQEAGSVIFGNGYTQFVGFGDDPGEQRYCFARVVDYSSAVCLLVRRRAFLDVGGFDPLYSPAYFEDVDLCLTLRARGLHTVYQPRSVVTHIRGWSGHAGGAPEQWAANLPLLTSRWRDLLKFRPEYTPQDGDPWLQLAARDAPASRRILMIADRFPSSSPSLGDPRALWLLRELSSWDEEMRITLLAPPAGRAADLETLLAAGVEVAVAENGGKDWLAGRAYHYDAVIVRGQTLSTDLHGALEDLQPQALQIVDVDSLSLSCSCGRDDSAGSSIPGQSEPDPCLESLSSSNLLLFSLAEDEKRAKSLWPATKSALLPGPVETEDKEELADAFASVGIVARNPSPSSASVLS